MRESIGTTFTYNIIIIFILMVFAFIAGTMSYFKAYKVNTKIISSIEKYEGYNELAKQEINSILASMGYRSIRNLECPFKDGSVGTYPQDSTFSYCVHLFCNNEYEYSFGVTTYIYIDFPVISSFIRIPIYTKTQMIHNMTGWECHIEE